MSWSARTSRSGLFYPNKYYWSSANPNANFEDCMANCTTYAYGRQLENGRSAPVTVIRNANLWHTVVNTDGGWELLNYTSGMSLQAGDIVEYTSPANHVAVVEYDGTDPVLSGSWWTDDSGTSSSGTRTIGGAMGSTIQDVSNFFENGSATALYRFWHNDRGLSREAGVSGVTAPTYVLRYTGEEPSTYTLSYDVSPSGSGYFTGSAQGEYEAGESITITAHANSGYIFKRLVNEQGDVYTDPTITRTMSRNRSYIAYFELDDSAEIIACTMTIKKKKGQINEITILV